MRPIKLCLLLQHLQGLRKSDGLMVVLLNTAMDGPREYFKIRFDGKNLKGTHGIPRHEGGAHEHYSSAA